MSYIVNDGTFETVTANIIEANNATIGSTLTANSVTANSVTGTTSITAPTIAATTSVTAPNATFTEVTTPVVNVKNGTNTIPFTGVQYATYVFQGLTITPSGTQFALHNWSVPFANVPSAVTASLRIVNNSSFANFVTVAVVGVTATNISFQLQNINVTSTAVGDFTVDLVAFP